MFAWRIAKAKRADDLSGKGAALDGGRWNDVEVPAVYMGLTPAICCLETFIHASHYPVIPLKITQFELPDKDDLYFQPDAESLPNGWSSIPPDRASMQFGTKWLTAGKHLGLIVPSAVLPLERNVVINPAHPAIKDIHIRAQFDFMYDDRMFNARKFEQP